MISVIKRPYGIDWCRMPMPLRLNSDRKFATVITPYFATFRFSFPYPGGLTSGKYIRIQYNGITIVFTGTPTPEADSGTQYYADGTNFGSADIYFQRNYYINRDFNVTHSINIGASTQTITFTAKAVGTKYKGTIDTDDSIITPQNSIGGTDASPTPNFAYLIDIYLQKTNTDNVNGAAFERLSTIALAPNTSWSEVDLAPEILPYTKPQPPTPYPGIGFTTPEYLRLQALRYKVKITEVYGTEPTPQIGEELIALVPYIDSQIAVRGGVQKNIYPWVYYQGNDNWAHGTACTWHDDKLWLTSLPLNILRRVSKRQYNWLTILAKGDIDGAKVKIKYFNDASGNTEFTLFTLDWPNTRTTDDAIPLRIPVGLPVALGIHAPSFEFNKYQILIIDAEDNPLYPPVTFWVEPEHANERFLFFENGLGGWESLRLIGGKVNFGEVTGEMYTRLNDLFNDVKHTPDEGNTGTVLQEEMELNSGPLHTVEELYWFVEMLVSENIYFYNYYNEHADYYRVKRIPDTFQLQQDDNNHFYINFKVRKAWKDSATGFLPIY